MVPHTIRQRVTLVYFNSPAIAARIHRIFTLGTQRRSINYRIIHLMNVAHRLGCRIEFPTSILPKDKDIAGYGYRVGFGGARDNATRIHLSRIPALIGRLTAQECHFRSAQ